MADAQLNLIKVKHRQIISNHKSRRQHQSSLGSRTQILHYAPNWHNDNLKMSWQIMSFASIDRDHSVGRPGIVRFNWERLFKGPRSRWGWPALAMFVGYRQRSCSAQALPSPLIALGEWRSTKWWKSCMSWTSNKWGARQIEKLYLLKKQCVLSLPFLTHVQRFSVLFWSCFRSFPSHFLHLSLRQYSITTTFQCVPMIEPKMDINWHITWPMKCLMCDVPYTPHIRKLRTGAGPNFALNSELVLIYSLRTLKSSWIVHEKFSIILKLDAEVPLYLTSKMEGVQGPRGFVVIIGAGTQGRRLAHMVSGDVQGLEHLIWC